MAATAVTRSAARCTRSLVTASASARGAGTAPCPGGVLGGPSASAPLLLSRRPAALAARSGFLSPRQRLPSQTRGYNELAYLGPTSAFWPADLPPPGTPGPEGEPPGPVTFPPHSGRQPLLLPTSVKLHFQAEPEPRRTKFEGCRKLVLTGPKGTTDVYIPPYVRMWLEEAPSDENSPPGESGSAPQKAARKVDPSDPNNLGDPTALSANMRLLWMLPDDIEDLFQHVGWGETHLRLSKAIAGVNEGYCVPVRINGVGYRVALVQPSKPGERPVLSCKLGFPNTFEHPVPEGIDITVYNPTSFALFGPDKEKLLKFAMAVRAHRKPEPYKLKGVFVDGETIKKKEAKKGRA